jgi:hypothetical protein
MPGSQQTRGKTAGQLSSINPEAAGLDVGAIFHVVGAR